MLRLYSAQTRHGSYDIGSSRHGQAEKSLAFHRHDQKDDEITQMTKAIHKADRIIKHNTTCIRIALVAVILS